MTYLWEIPDNYPSSLIGVYQRDVSRDRFDFFQGKALKQSKKPLIFELKAHRNKLQGIGCLCNNSGSLLLSPEVVNVLNTYALQDVQFFDTTVKTKDGETDEFKLLNVTRYVDCVDRDKSNIRVIGNIGRIDLERIEELIHKVDCMQEVMIARDKNESGHIVVNNKLADKLNDLCMPGIALVRPEDVYP